MGSSRRGVKRRWEERDLEVVEQWLDSERRHTSRQLCQKLEQERGIKLGIIPICFQQRNFGLGEAICLQNRLIKVNFMERYT